MSLDSHSRRHSLDDPFGESPPSSFASRPPPPPASLSFPRHSLEQRRPNAAGHGQSLSWSGPGDGYVASRQQESYNFPSSSAFRQQQQQQQPAHPLASLMLGGDVAPRTPIDYNSYYTSQASSDAAQPEPRTRDWGSGHQSGGGADGDGDTDSHVFEDWEQGSPMVKEEEEVQDWGDYGEQEHEGGWDIAEVDERQQQWAPRGSEQTSQHGYDTYSTRQRFNNPYPSPYEPSAELPPLPALPSTYGTPPQSSVGFTPSSLPVSTHYTQQDSSYTPQYSTQSLSLSAPEARSYPSFSSFGDFSPTTTAAAQVLYDSRPHQQHSNQLGTPFRSSRPQNRPRAFTSSSVGGQGSLLAPMLEMHHSPTSMSATSSAVFEDYNHPMSMSPQSPISPLELPPLPLPSLDDDNDRCGSDPALRVSTSTLASDRPPSKPVQRRKRGSLPKEVDPKSGRPLSPITGLPTKVIAKRGWPPKDMAKRVYTCPYEGCDRIFGRPSARETHIRSHNGVQPFNCPISSCRRPFSVFSNLKRHMIVHPTVDFRSVTVNDLPHIHCVETEQGPMLEWDDAEEDEAEFGPAVGSGGEEEGRGSFEGMGEGDKLEWRRGEEEDGRRRMN